MTVGKIDIVRKASPSVSVKDLLATRKGVVAVVYMNKCSLLVQKLGNTGIGCAFWEGNSFTTSINSWTEGSFENILNRLADLDSGTKTQQQYYYFETLQQFARAVIDNGWEWSSY